MRGRGDVSKPRAEWEVLICRWGGQITAHNGRIANCLVTADFEVFVFKMQVMKTNNKALLLLTLIILLAGFAIITLFWAVWKQRVAKLINEIKSQWCSSFSSAIAKKYTFYSQMSFIHYVSWPQISLSRSRIDCQWLRSIFALIICQLCSDHRHGLLMFVWTTLTKLAQQE